MARMQASLPSAMTGRPTQFTHGGHAIEVLPIATANGWTWKASIGGKHSIEGADGSLRTEALAIAEGFAEAQNFVDSKSD